MFSTSIIVWNRSSFKKSRLSGRLVSMKLIQCRNEVFADVLNACICRHLGSITLSDWSWVSSRHFVLYAHFLTCEANFLIVVLRYARHTLRMEKAAIIGTWLVSWHCLDRRIRRRVVLVQRTDYTLCIPLVHHRTHAFSFVVRSEIFTSHLIHIFNNQVRVFERDSLMWLLAWRFWGCSLCLWLTVCSNLSQLVGSDIGLSYSAQVKLWFSC